MSDWTIRDAEFSDLEALVRLDDASTTAGQPPAFHFADVVSAVARKCPAVLAISSDGGIVGAAISSVSGDEAWVLRLSLAPSHRNRGMGSALLGQLGFFCWLSPNLSRQVRWGGTKSGGLQLLRRNGECLS